MRTPVMRDLEDVAPQILSARLEQTNLCLGFRISREEHGDISRPQSEHDGVGIRVRARPAKKGVFRSQNLQDRMLPH